MAQNPVKSNIEIQDPREPKINIFSHLKIYQIIGFNWIILLIGTFGSVSYGVIPIIVQYVLGDLIKAFTHSNTSQDTLNESINQVCVKLTIITFCGGLAMGIYHHFQNWANVRIGTCLREAYMSSLIQQDIHFFEIRKIGSLMSCLTEDIPKIQDVLTNEFNIFMQEIMQFIVGLILSLTCDWKNSLLFISTIPLTLISHTTMSVLSTKLVKKMTMLTRTSAGVANEITTCIRTIRSMAGEKSELTRYKHELKDLNQKGLMRSSIHGIAFGFAATVVWGTVSLTFWYSGHQAVSGLTDLASLFQVFGMMLVGSISLIRSATFFPQYMKSYVSETHLLKVILRKPEISLSGGKQISVEQLKGDIEFDQVCFSYPSRPQQQVLTDFSLKIKQGQSIALVGPSGSGKSTIVSLLERFYIPQKGKILIDGLDLNEIDPNFLHKQIGIVEQEPVLFSKSIRYNIAYAVGLEHVSQEDIEKAAKQANAHQFIMDLHDGYETMLGEKGVSLSGGQKQRIAIARALLQNPKILLLDEATSALDTESEKLVQQALENLMKNRTTICIAHRLTTVINSDVICVMVKGVIREMGSHHELLKIENGIYQNLAMKQMLSSKSEENLDIVP